MHVVATIRVSLYPSSSPTHRYKRLCLRIRNEWLSVPVHIHLPEWRRIETCCCPLTSGPRGEVVISRHGEAVLRSRDMNSLVQYFVYNVGHSNLLLIVLQIRHHQYKLTHSSHTHKVTQSTKNNVDSKASFSLVYLQMSHSTVVCLTSQLTRTLDHGCDLDTRTFV